MQTINLSNRNQIDPIEFTPYTGENVCVNTTIRKGKRIQDIKFFSDVMHYIVTSCRIIFSQ